MRRSYRGSGQPRRGAMLILVAVMMIPIIAFLALAIDLGMMAMARTHAQMAADVAAMSGARTLNGKLEHVNASGSTDAYGYGSSSVNGKTAAMENRILSTDVAEGNITELKQGHFVYNEGDSAFEAIFDDSRPGPWTAMRSTVTYTGTHSVFASMIGAGNYNLSTTAIAVHRPRDIGIIIDFSGSMGHGSSPPGGGVSTSSNFPLDRPKFGHYASSNVSSNNHKSNHVMATSSAGPGYIDGDPTRNINGGYYKHLPGATKKVPPDPPEPAFKSQPSSYATAPAGDAWPTVTRVQDLVGTTARVATWELDGYDSLKVGYTYADGLAPDDPNAFKGYTVGPGYFGKTFFIWPPDPRYPLGNSASDLVRVRQFLIDFGFEEEDLDNPVTNQAQILARWRSNLVDPVGNQWTNETLDTHLTTNLGLATTSDRYKQVMRLFNRPKFDWRKRFFLTGDGSGPLEDTTKMFNTGNGTLRSPGDFRSTGVMDYRINYKEILEWINNTPMELNGGSIIPTRLRSGRVLYYGFTSNSTASGIPTDITSITVAPNSDQSTLTNDQANQRFWKAYIDYVLGVRQTDNGTGGTWTDTQWTVDDPSYGARVNFGSSSTVKTYALPAVSTTDLNSLRYMDYRDNPRRPRLHYWFGAVSMSDFIDGNWLTSNEDRSWLSGTVHEAQLWGMKVGARASLLDMKNNHPNDTISMAFFCVPTTSGTPKGAATGSGKRFNRPRVPQGINYQRAIDVLFFPIETVDDPDLEVRPWFTYEVPRAGGGTCYSHPLMLIYNQFSNPSSASALRNYNTLPNAPVGDAGGLGRRGAQKMVIFLTDGQCLTESKANFNNSGAHESYYKVRFPGEVPTNVSGNNQGGTDGLAALAAYGVCRRICADETQASTFEDGSSTPANYAGFSRGGRKAIIHCAGYGDAFENGGGGDAREVLRRMQAIGSVDDDPDTAGNQMADFKFITGTQTERISKMTSAFKKIMQSGITISLIK